MRTELLGLELNHALSILKAEGTTPSVTMTTAPKNADRQGTLRVVFSSDSGGQLIVSRFVDPIADAPQEEEK